MTSYPLSSSVLDILRPGWRVRRFQVGDHLDSGSQGPPSHGFNHFNGADLCCRTRALDFLRWSSGEAKASKRPKSLFKYLL